MLTREPIFKESGVTGPIIAFVYYFSVCGTILVASLLLPVLLAFGYGENDVAFRLLSHLALSGFLFAGVFLSVRGRHGQLDRLTVMFLCVFSWLTLPIVAALPFSDIMGLSWVDAYFMSVSGFTTTGAEILPLLDTVPKSLLFMRAQLQWMGGLATLLTFTLVLGPSRIGGLPTENLAGFSGVSVSSERAMVSLFLDIAKLYLLFTIVCFAALLATGAFAFDAAILTLSTISTGGFMPSDQSIDLTVGYSGMLVMAFFLIVSSTNLFWHQMIFSVRGADLVQHRESYFLIAIWLFVGVLFAGVIMDAGGANDALSRSRATAEGIFNAASVVSTSGMQSREGIFALFAPTAVLALLLLGGGAYSTSSGFKFYRLGAILTQSAHELSQLINPHAIRARHIGSMRYDMQMMKAIWALFVLTLILVCVGAGILGFYGMEFEAAFIAAVSAFANAGPAYTPLWTATASAGWPAYHEMADVQKMVLVALMFLGRLELTILFSALNVFYWVKR